MIIQVLGRALGMFFLVAFLVACITAFNYFMLRQSEKADIRFEVRMGKDIDRITGELKDAGLDDKTVEVLQRALQDVQQNTESYVSSKSSTQFFLLLFMAIMYPSLLIPLGFALMNQKKAMADVSIARPRFTV